MNLIYALSGAFGICFGFVIALSGLPGNPVAMLAGAGMIASGVYLIDDLIRVEK